MKIRTCWALFVALFSCVAFLRAQEPPQFPSPEKQHEWLKQLVGEWETSAECKMVDPPLKCQGTETGRLLGGFWAVVEGKSEMGGMSVATILTVGYDPKIKKYVGTWVDSSNSYMWKYEGTVDPSGKALTLETEGPNPLDPAKQAKFRETIEFKSKDHKVFTSAMQGDDGKWTTFMTANARRKGTAPLGSSASGR